MKIEISKLAQCEFNEAQEFYEIGQAGLGKRFESEMKQALQRIKQYPEAFSIETGEIRKCLTHKFPYKILFSIEANTIVVLAFAHQHRRPNYWIDRENLTNHSTRHSR